MPLPLILPAIIAGATALGSAAWGYFNQRKTNEEQKQYNEDMMNKQNQFNLDMYNKTNDYNSPVKQMQRFQEAGLNPNLIYGQGNNGNANMAHSASAGAYTPTAPKMDLLQGLQAYMSFREQGAQYDNLRAQNTLLAKEAALKDADIAAKALTNSRTEFDLHQARALNSSVITKASNDAAMSSIDLQQADETKLELGRYSLEAASLANRRANVGWTREQQQLDIDLAANQRAEIMNAASVQEAVARTLKIRAEITKIPYEKQLLFENIKNAYESDQLKMLDHNLKSQGIQPGDQAWERALQSIIRQIVEKIKK